MIQQKDKNNDIIYSSQGSLVYHEVLIRALFHSVCLFGWLYCLISSQIYRAVDGGCKCVFVCVNMWSLCGWEKEKSCMYPFLYAAELSAHLSNSPECYFQLQWLSAKHTNTLLET